MARIGIKCLLCEEVILLEGMEEQRAFCGLMVPPKICNKCRKLWWKIKEGVGENKDEKDN